MRLIIWLLLIPLAVLVDMTSPLIIDFHFALVLAFLTVAGWLWFGYWLKNRFQRRQLFSDVSKVTLAAPLAFTLPFAVRVGSASGTLLLGSSDHWLAQSLRALLGVVIVPALLLVALTVMRTMTAATVLGKPVLWFMSLIFAFGLHIHLAQRAFSRRSMLWLRGNWDARGLLSLVESVIFREWLALLVALFGICLLSYFFGLLTLRVVVVLVAWLVSLRLQSALAMVCADRVSSSWQFWFTFAHLLIVIGVIAVTQIVQVLTPLFYLIPVQILCILTLRRYAYSRI